MKVLFYSFVVVTVANIICLLLVNIKAFILSFIIYIIIVSLLTLKLLPVNRAEKRSKKDD